MLSKREREVLKLIAAGFKNGEVAGRLGISRATAHSHVRNMCDKTGARTHAELAALAVREGWLEDDIADA